MIIVIDAVSVLIGRAIVQQPRLIVGAAVHGSACRAIGITLDATAATAQTAPDFTGKWEGTFTRQLPDGTAGPAQAVVFNLIQKGKTLTGTAGPADQQWKVEKGEVAAGKATFEVQQPDGPLIKFALTIVKGRLQGDMSGERNGEVRKAKVDAAKAK